MKAPDYKEPAKPKKKMGINELDYKVRSMWDSIVRGVERENDTPPSDNKETLSDIEYERRRKQKIKDAAKYEYKMMKKCYKAKMNDFEMFLYHMGLTLKKDKITTKERMVMATKKLKPSNIVYKEAPYTYALKNNVCHNCWKQKYAHELNRCTQCKFAWYCSKKCQLDDWKNGHSHRCKSIKKSHLNDQGLPLYKYMSVLIVAETMYKLKHQQIPILPEDAIQEYTTIGEEKAPPSHKRKAIMRQQRYIKEKLMDLHIQREIVPTLNDHIGLVIDGDSDKAADIDELSGYIHEYLIEYYKTFIKKKKNETKQEFLKRKKNVKIDYTFKDVTRFLMKYNINSSEMYLDNFVSFGMMLCPFTSLINHSCNPNCHIRINPKTKNMELRVLTDIDVGDELFVTYLGNETTKPTRARKEVLKNKYYFECNCNLCKPTTKKRKMMERLMFEPCCKACFLGKNGSENYKSTRGINRITGKCENNNCGRIFNIRQIYGQLSYCEGIYVSCKKDIRLLNDKVMRNKGKLKLEDAIDDFKSILKQVKFGLTKLNENDLCVTEFHYLRLGLLQIKSEIEGQMNLDDDRINTCEEILKYYVTYLDEYNPYLGKEYILLGGLQSWKASQYKEKIRKIIDQERKPPPKKWFTLAYRYFKRSTVLREQGLRVLRCCVGEQSDYIKAHETQMQDDIDNGKKLLELKDGGWGVAKLSDGSLIIGRNPTPKE